jgi:carbon storage regulator
MLVLSRKNGEAICIGTDIKVRIVAQRYGRVRLGVEAPPGVMVNREEIAEEIRRQAAESAEVSHG